MKWAPFRGNQYLSRFNYRKFQITVNCFESPYNSYLQNFPSGGSSEIKIHILPPKLSMHKNWDQK